MVLKAIPQISSPAEFRRLYQALLRQGFDAEIAVSVLKANQSLARHQVG